MCSGFSPEQAILCDTSWVPTIQPHANTIYQETVSNVTGEGLGPTTLTPPPPSPTLDASRTLRLPLVLSLMLHPAVDQRLQRPLLGLDYFARAAHGAQRNTNTDLYLPGSYTKDMIKDTDEHPDGRDAQYVGKDMERPLSPTSMWSSI